MFALMCRLGKYIIISHKHPSIQGDWMIASNFRPFTIIVYEYVTPRPTHPEDLSCLPGREDVVVVIAMEKSWPTTTTAKPRIRVCV